MAPKAKPETVTATDETTLPLEVLPEAPADLMATAAQPVIVPTSFGVDLAQSADEQITYVVEGNAEGNLTFTPVAPADDAQPEPAPEAPEPAALPDPEALPPVPSDAEIADPVAMPDAKLLRALIASIEARNTDLHRPALWTELERAGAVVESGRLVLAGVSAAGEGQRKGMLANWTNAARRKLMEMGNA